MASGSYGGRYYRVVGVVGDVRSTAFGEPPVLGIYYPIVAIPGQPRWWPSTMYLVVARTRANRSGW